MNKFWKRLQAALLILALIPGYSGAASQIHAEEYPEIVGEEDDPVISPVYSIEVNRKSIVFDFVEGSTPDSEVITVTNTGTVSVTVERSWNVVTSPFNVQIPGNAYIAPGESTAVVVSVPALGAGTYEDTLCVYAADHEETKIPIPMLANVGKRVVEPVVYGVSLNPGSVTTSPGERVPFDAAVTGENIRDYTVSWEISGATSPNTQMDGRGTLQIGQDERGEIITLVARSNQDKSKSASATVYIKKGNVQLNLQASPVEGGVVAGGGTYVKGSDVTLNASANNGFVFVNWTEGNNIVSTANKFTISNIGSNRNIVANFKKSSVNVYTEMSPASGAGTVSPSAFTNYGGNISVTAQAANGYTFVGWKENNVFISNQPTLTFNNLTTDKKVTACFEKTILTLKLGVDPKEGGVAEGGGNYGKNAKVTIKATANKGYEFTGWYVNGSKVSNQAVYVIEKLDKDATYVAGFSKIGTEKFVIKASAGNTGGTISPNGTMSVDKGKSVTFVMTPKAGYRISQVLIDSVYVGNNNKYTFTSVTANHEIIAYFEKLTENNGGNKKPEPTPIPIQEELPEDLHQDDVINTDDTAFYENLTGILAEYNVTRDEAARMIAANQATEMLEAAYREGYIAMTVNNDYANNQQATATNEFFTNPSITNYEDILRAMLTENEVLDALEGKRLAVNVNITNLQNTVPTGEKNTLTMYADKYNKNIVNCFDISMIKSSDINGSSEITDLGGKTAYFVLAVPKELIGKELSVIHVHHTPEGLVEKEILEDLDDSDTTVTIGVSKLSTFAFVEDYKYPWLDSILKLIVLVLIILVMVMIAFTIVRIATGGRRKRSVPAGNADFEQYRKVHNHTGGSQRGGSRPTQKR